MLATLPEQGARTSCLAFIASTAATTWPSVTASPTFTPISTSSTLPLKGEKTGVAVAGAAAGAYINADAKEGALSIDHVVAFNKEAEEADVPPDRVSPMLLPDYTLQHTKDRQLTTHYVGTMR